MRRHWRTGHTLAAIAIATTIVTASSPAAAQGFFYLDSAANCFTVGIATWQSDGVSRASLCWRNNAGTEVLERLRTDLSTGGLNQHVIILADAGGDSGTLVPSNGYNPTDTCDCNASTSSDTWNTLIYNGYYLDIDGQGGNDTLSRRSRRSGPFGVRTARRCSCDSGTTPPAASSWAWRGGA